MLSRIFPKQFDNTYRGHWLAIWIFVPVVLVKLIMGVNVAGLNPLISNLDILKTADGVPLDTFGAEAASTVVFLFASWALGLLLLSLLAIVVLIRYRAMIPLMYLLLSIEQIGRKALLLINPIVRAVETEGISFGAFINWGLTAALVIGFVLSLQNRSDSR
jgi:hypothetical protein